MALLLFLTASDSSSSGETVDVSEFEEEIIIENEIESKILDAGDSGEAFGSAHSLILKPDGTVWTWGYNYYGQLGDGSKITRIAPFPVEGLGEVVSVSGGSDFSLALKKDGTTSTRSTPVQVMKTCTTKLTGIVSISAGPSFSLFLKYDGIVWSCGRNSSGNWAMELP